MGTIKLLLAAFLPPEKTAAKQKSFGRGAMGFSYGLLLHKI
jgi:hypothetical protein